MIDKQELYSIAENYDGGSIRLIKKLDEYNVPYELSSKKPTVRIAIRTSAGTIAFYDRKKEIKVRADIPWEHLLSQGYESIGGYIFNERNKDFESKSYISVYFDEQHFDELAKYLKDHIF